MTIWRGNGVGRSRGGSSRVGSPVPSRRLALTYTGSDNGVGTPKFDGCMSPQSPVTWRMTGLGRSRLERFRCMSPQSPWIRNRFDTSPPGSLISGFNWSFDDTRCDSPTSLPSRPNTAAEKRRLFAANKSWSDIERISPNRSFDRSTSVDRSTRKVSPCPKDARLSLLRSGFRQNSVRQLVEIRPRNLRGLLLKRAQSASDLPYMSRQLQEGKVRLYMS